LKKDVKLGWTDKAKEQIAIAKGENPSNASGAGTSTGGNQSGTQGGNQGGSQNQGGNTNTSGGDEPFDGGN
jgi:hypothetical protein